VRQFFPTLHHVATAKMRCAAVLFPDLANGRTPQGGGSAITTWPSPPPHLPTSSFPHAAGGRFGPCCHSGSRRAYAWDSVAEQRCVGFGFPWWAGRGRETVAWGGRGRRYTARVGELVVLVEAAMARESESPPSAASAVVGDASGGDGGRPKKAKARRPTDVLTQAVETVLDGVARAYIHRVG
jgi:hypothetical protein